LGNDGNLVTSKLSPFFVLAAGVVAALLGSCSGDSGAGGQPLTPTSAATAPTEPSPEGPTPWGEFLIVPVNVSSGDDGALSPGPVFGDSAVKTGDLGGPDAPAKAAALVPRFVDLGPQGLALVASIGLTAVGAEASQNPDGTFVSGVFYGRIEPRPAMVQLTALTPIHPIRITRFPDTPIYDFVTSMAVNGNPTITKFPDKGTSDPNGAREIRWSQEGVAYTLQSGGPISDDQLLAAAVEISVAESKRP
jgi:hypothetical protein